MQSLVIEPRPQRTRADRIMRTGSLVFGALGLLIVPIFFPEADSSTITACLIVFVGTPMIVWGLTFLEGRQSATPLEIDRRGLTCPTFGSTEARRWTWPEVSAFQVIERPEDPHFNARFIRFLVPADLRVPIHLHDASPVEARRAEVRIYDRYDPSLQQIADDLNAARARGLGLSSRAAADAMPPGADRRAAYPQPVEFLADHERQWSQLLLIWSGAFLLSFAFSDVGWMSWALSPLLFFVMTATLLVDFFVFRRRRRERQAVGLDGRGLTCSFAGREQRWDWREVGACRFAGPSGGWRHILGRYLVIEVARAPAAPRLVRSLLRRLFGCQVVVLADIYLVSLEEVAAKVAAYRDSAQEREA